CFKTLQLAVFFGWCYLYGEGTIIALGEPAPWMAIGGALIAFGQVLNVGVFVRLGKIGVFYGNRLGYHIQWCKSFPFSLVPHPQYVGAVLSIWGFFMTTRFPHDDWFMLPLLQTGYYVAGAYLEQLPDVFRPKLIIDRLGQAIQNESARIRRGAETWLRGSEQ